MKSNRKTTLQMLLAALCLGATGWSAFRIYRTEFAAPKFNLVLHQEIGRVLAEETAKLVNQTGRVVVVAIELRGVPELRAQLEEFERVLHQSPGITLEKSYKLDTDDKPKYSFGAGLSGRRLVRIISKNPHADAIVSFIGAPSLSEAEIAQLKRMPKFIAETRSADKLKQLFDHNVLHAAVVSRFQFPTPIKGTPSSPRDWFDQRFQVVTARNAGDLPSGRED